MILSQLTQALFAELKQAIPGRVSELPDAELRLLIESCLQRLDLVTRSEFDAQQAVLLRTREKLQKLEQQLTVLQDQLNNNVADD